MERLSKIEQTNLTTLAAVEKGRVRRKTSGSDSIRRVAPNTESNPGTEAERKAILRTWGIRQAEEVNGVLSAYEYELMDYDADGDNDAVCVYSILGANEFTSRADWPGEQVMAVFTNSNGTLLFQCSTKAGKRFHSWIRKIVSATDSVIYCTTSVWLDSDPRCCPTGTGTKAFIVRGSQLLPAE